MRNFLTNSMEKPKLSIIVLSLNTKKLLMECLDSLKRVRKEINFEVIVVDNGSTDGTVAMLRNFQFPRLRRDFGGQAFFNFQFIENKKNLGFAAGNNKARPYCRGKYILFLNSDTTLPKGTLKEMVSYMEKNPQVGAATCKILLPGGSLDKDARRAFITPWIGLTHLYLKLDRIFPKSKLFAKYWYGYIPDNKIHEVDALQGAFFLSPKKVLDKVGWFDEDYFLDGEDIDLSWRIKEQGYKVMYYPMVSILHKKGASKGKVGSATKKRVPIDLRLRHRMAGVNSMEIFYRKHLWSRYPLIFNIFVLAGIKTLKGIRYIRTLVLG